jgi:hypothetical protein
MTQVTHTECDSCGNVIELDLQPMWILCGRINNALRLDICPSCFKTTAPEDLLFNARERGVNLGE